LLSSQLPLNRRLIGRRMNTETLQFSDAERRVIELAVTVISAELDDIDRRAADPTKAGALPVETVNRLLVRHAAVGELQLDKSAVSRRVGVALKAGFLRNLETCRGQPARLIVGEPFPEEMENLPRPDRVTEEEARCSIDRESGGIDAPPSLQEDRTWRTRPAPRV
jgi:hypothetical protein